MKVSGFSKHFLIWAKIIYHILGNYKTKTLCKLGYFKTTTGSTHSRFSSVSDSLKYINQVFQDYLSFADISVKDIKGKKVLELGPGDNFGVALKFLIAGANKVTCLDKFYSNRDIAQQYQIYKAMRDELLQGGKRSFDSIIKLNNHKFEFTGNKFEYIYDRGIEQALEIFPSASFDMIISRAVLEHIPDLDAAFNSMDKLLRPGGYMIHNIDLRDHGIFTSVGLHPLTFLTIPEKIWKLMTGHSGKPNRMRLDYYKHKMEELNYNYRIKIILSSTLPMIENIKPKLQPEFKKMLSEDLLPETIFLIAQKSRNNPSADE
ncbi:class I SAM-dependent methyltransferase [candidate division WOR-3 bacterium]|nr:class I SAM-dependent methyltransferase [candidate division WOR-3 bacterium]